MRAPRSRDPERFLRTVRGKRVVFDEVRRLHEPAERLKVAADHFPDARVLATGSSTLQATAKFRGRDLVTRLSERFPSTK